MTGSYGIIIMLKHLKLPCVSIFEKYLLKEVEEMSSLKNRIRKKAQEDSILGKFLSLGYMLFSNGIFQSLVSAIGAIILAVFTGLGIYNGWFVGFLLIYILLILLSGWVTEHTRGKNSDLVWFQKAIENHRVIESRTTNSFIKLAKKVYAHPRTGSAARLTLKGLHSDWDFQNAAFSVCYGIYNMINSISNCKNLYVSVYQRLKGQEGEDDIIKLIAYHGRLATAQPTDYMKRYSINDKDYFAKIIKSNNSQIRILENQQKVRENFLIHESSREREEKICQYIGIPILVSGFSKDEGQINQVGFLLQIDVDIPDFFGKDKQEIEEKAYNILYMYADFLHMSYEMGRFIDSAFEKWYETKGTQKGTGGSGGNALE